MEENTAMIKNKLQGTPREARFDPWSGNWIPHAANKSIHMATKIPSAVSKTWYSQINKKLSLKKLKIK